MTAAQQAYSKAYYQANKERIKARVRSYAAVRRDEISAKNKERRIANAIVEKARKREYYQKNRLERIKKQKQYAAARREEIRAYKKQWWADGRAKHKAKKHEHYTAHREAHRARSKAKYDANPELVKARTRAYAVANPGKTRERQKAYRAANAPRLAVMKLEWQRADYRRHPEKYRERQSHRKALKLGATAERIDFKKVLRDAKGLCGICRKPFDLFGIDFDHIVPLARGGTHTQSNIQATHARCNRSKGAKVI